MYVKGPNFFDNLTNHVIDYIKTTFHSSIKLDIAAANISIYASQLLKKEQVQIDEFH
jgi:hypothetical protein